jgi:hypothetical protein
LSFDFRTGTCRFRRRPQDADYARLAAQALTPDEVEQRRLEWRAKDAELHQEFLRFAQLVNDQYWPDQERGPDAR